VPVPRRRFIVPAILLLVAAAAGLRYVQMESGRARSQERAVDADVQELRRVTTRLSGAVRIDPDAPVEVPDGTLVVVTGLLTGEDSVTDPIYHFTRAGVVALRRRVDVFDRVLLERELKAPEAVRDPGLGAAPGYSDWLTSPGFVLTRKVTTPVTRWQSRDPGESTDAESSHIFHRAARVGRVPLSEALTRSVSLYRMVILDEADRTRVPQPLRERLFVNNGSYTIGYGDADGDLRITFFEVRSEEVTLLAEWRDGALHVWHDPVTGDPYPLARPGRLDLPALVDPREVGPHVR
jgi:hypothetical protein